MTKETQYTTYPVCPYCGYEHPDAWEWDFGAGTEGNTEIECDNCEKEFFVSRMVEVSYSTRKIKR